MYPSSAIAVLLVLVGFIWLSVHRRRKNGRKLPPGPPALPVIGNLHMLGPLPHRNLHDLAKKYGPIMFIRLGSVPTIVVSSPKAAELFLKTHDTIFCSRPKVQASEYLSYGTKGMAFTGYGPYWRSVRKFCTVELLSAAKVDSYAEMRREQVDLLVRSLAAAAAAHEVVDVSEKVEEVIEEMTYRMVFGDRSSNDCDDLKAAAREAVAIAGSFNIADFVPFLAPFDLQGLTRRLKKTHKIVDKILERIIDEHEQKANTNESGCQDLINQLLALMTKSSTTHDILSNSISRNNIKAIALDMIVGALDTSSTAIEWTMTELLRHPKVMKKLQEELKNVIGEDRLVEEKDLVKLNYLEMVIKESIRLHPVAPLLVPRESMEDITVNDYYIPKKSRIFVNYWAIGRDLDAWSENADEFSPERFIGSDVDFRGQHFELIPFGAGRRRCPGMHLGMVNIRLVVAQLVHCFHWEMPNGMSPMELDMSEKFGLSLPRAMHLLAIPTCRLRL